jgi:hypothetical protein
MTKNKPQIRGTLAKLASCAPLAALLWGAAFNARADYVSAVSNLNPLVYYRLNEPAAAIPIDLATNYSAVGAAADLEYLGYAGSSYMHPVTNGLTGSMTGAAAFTGGYAMMPYSSNILGSFNQQTFAAEAWVNANANPAGAICSAVNLDGRYGWILYYGLSAGDLLDFRLYQGNGVNFAAHITATVPDSEWHHVVAQSDGTNALLYVDGALVGTNALASYVPPPSFPFGSTLSVCARNDGSYQLSALVAQVAIYSNALTSAQVLNHYNTGTNTSPSAYNSVVLGDGAICYWPLNDGLFAPPDPSTYPVATNIGTLGSAGNGVYLPGTTPGMPGPSFPGMAGSGACHFNGVGSTAGGPGANGAGPGYVDIGAGGGIDSVDFTTNITLVAWVQLDEWLNDYQCIVGKGDDSWRMQRGGETNFIWGFDYDAAGDTAGITGGGDTDHAWHQTVGVYDGTNLWIYVDGVAEGVAPQPGLNLYNNTFLASIGENTEYPGRTWAGNIAEVAIFDTALTPSQVFGLWQAAQGTTGVGILWSPTSETVLQGQTASFSVAAVGGTPPYSYQWKLNGTSISNGTSSNYTIVSVGVADAGTYTAVVSDAAHTSATSRPATLVVETPSQVPLTPVGVTNYPVLVMSMGPVAYYPLTETSGTTAMDLAGGHDGFFANDSSDVTPGGATGPVGVAATAYSFGGNSGVDCFAAGYPTIPASEYWNFDFNNFTMTAWFQTTSVGVPILIDQGRYGPPFLYCNQPNTGDIRFGFDNWYQNWNNGDQAVAASGVTDGNWHIVACTLNSLSQTMLLYVDGLVVASNTIIGAPEGGIYDTGPGSSPPWLEPYPLLIGGTPDGAGGNWTGAICQTAFFNRALSQAEIAELAVGGADTNTRTTIAVQPASHIALEGLPVTLSVVALPASPWYTYQWQKNGVNISGPAAKKQNYTIASVSSGDAGNYTVVVNGNGGPVTSEAAVLTLVPAAAPGSLQYGLVMHLGLDGNYRDSSGYGNDGQPTPWAPPPFVPGKIGQALQTSSDIGDGTSRSSCLSLGINSTTLQFGSNDDFSVSFWVNYTNSGTHTPFIGHMNWAPYGFNQDFSDAGWLIGEDGGQLQLSFGTTGYAWNGGNYGGGSGTPNSMALWNDTESGAPSLSDGTWHHVVMTMDKTNLLVTSYIDGAPVDTNASAFNGGTPLNLTGLGTFIANGDPVLGSSTGCTVDGGASGAVYKFDDVAIWRRLLAPAEVASIYTAGQSGQSFAGSVIVGLTIAPVSGGVQINWPSGTLWSSSSVSGPWNQVTNAAPPSYTTAAGGTAQFYIVK